MYICMFGYTYVTHTFTFKYKFIIMHNKQIMIIIHFISINKKILPINWVYVAIYNDSTVMLTTREIYLNSFAPDKRNKLITIICYR